MLDRDGVLNVDQGHVVTAERLVWMRGVPRAIQSLTKAGFGVVVVTNQAGIGRGLFTEDEFIAFSQRMIDELASDGAQIDRVYYCPHHPTEATPEMLLDCPCRKPRPGMLVRALRDSGARPELSMMIGDSEVDMTAARAAGVHGYRFSGGSLDEFVLRTLGLLTT